MYNFINMFLRKGMFALLLFSFFPLVTYTGVLATEVNLPNILVTPNNYLFYSLTRLTEKGLIFIKISKESKVDYFKNLTQKRLAELKYVVENKLLSEVQQSSQRLSYQIGILSDYLSTNQNQLSKQKLNTKNLLNSYKELLANLRDQYPANSNYWMLIQHNINSIDINLEKLK